jgi:lipopolysaccharide/colanic/teichoic acid biosynthesis glycosyltransferase
LSWEGAICLDLSYVENWSIVGDLLIMWQTARAVAAPGGYSCRASECLAGVVSR